MLDNLLDRQHRILNIGCGNAELTEDMYDDGYRRIINMDISSVVIDQMRERNLHRPEMTWEIGDALDMSYEDEYFDVVVDKSRCLNNTGTLDAILCGENSFFNAAKLTKEVQRVLKTGGIYLIISYGHPRTRIMHLVDLELYLEKSTLES